jgi:predicted acylesterase/phospholipase RssA
MPSAPFSSSGNREQAQRNHAELHEVLLHVSTPPHQRALEMLDLCEKRGLRTAERKLPAFPKLTGSATALMVCAALIIGVPIDGSHAQSVTQTKKGAERKPAAKAEKRGPEERAIFTQEDEEAAIVIGFPEARGWGDSDSDFARLLPLAAGPWLAISGGGSNGAFGAGVLSGWSKAGNRPDFAVVTGASIGALIAPFAFLGSRYDDELRENFTTIAAADIFEDQPTRDSLFDYWPLKRLIEQRMTPKLLGEIAAEHGRGRRLLVVTTNLDSGRPVIWDMGAIAAHGDANALKLFREVLLASCSIPGFFSPVAIAVEAKGKRFQEMHGDGTLTAPFFVLPQTAFAADGTSRPPLTQLYVVVNSKLVPEFNMAENNVAGVLGRSIGVALTSALRSEVSLLSVASQRIGFALQIAHIDTAFTYPSRGPFDGKYMQALYEFGNAAGQKGAAFEDGASVYLRRSSAR